MVFETKTQEAPLIWDYERYQEIVFKEWPNVADVHALATVIAVSLQKGTPVVILPKQEKKK